MAAAFHLAEYIPDSQRGGRVKGDQHARDLFGSAYDAIPKSVFATMAFYLAGACCNSADDRTEVDARILEELDALTGQIISERQGKAASKAFRAATERKS